MGCAVVQQACSEVCTYIKVTCSSVYSCAVSVVCYWKVVANRPSLLTV